MQLAVQLVALVLLAQCLTAVVALLLAKRLVALAARAVSTLSIGHRRKQ
jgi:hypothetical protein